MKDKELAKDLIEGIISDIENVFTVIRKFEDNRAGAIAFTKLEEAIMWLNVMVNHFEVKETAEEKSSDA
jgi:hypothetical protein